jgi:Uma2 family endonuclease
VWVQNPIRLGERSEPQPDLALLRPRGDFYASGHPGPQDVLLVVEVAETSADADREVKVPLYARAGVLEA